MIATLYPVQFAVDYPDHLLDRVTTGFRLILALPIVLVVGAVSAGTYATNNHNTNVLVGAGGVLFFGPLLMIVFRQKYPRWWFDWNRELLRFVNCVAIYLALMDDRYPSTDEAQSVHLDFPYPNVPVDLNRWLPLVKWFLAFPHYVVLLFLDIAVVVVVIVAWFAILFTGRYPRVLFDFVEGVIRWQVHPQVDIGGEVELRSPQATAVMRATKGATLVVAQGIPCIHAVIR